MARHHISNSPSNCEVPYLKEDCGFFLGGFFSSYSHRDNSQQAQMPGWPAGKKKGAEVAFPCTVAWEDRRKKGRINPFSSVILNAGPWSLPRLVARMGKKGKGEEESVFELGWEDEQKRSHHRESTGKQRRFSYLFDGTLRGGKKGGGEHEGKGDYFGMSIVTVLCAFYLGLAREKL